MLTCKHNWIKFFFSLCHPYCNHVSDFFNLLSKRKKKKEMRENVSPEDILVFSLLTDVKRKEKEEWFGCGQYT